VSEPSQSPHRGRRVTVDRLDAEQKKALRQVASAHKKYVAAQERAEAAQRNRKEAIARALDLFVPETLIAKELGVSRAAIYRILNRSKKT
jgi:DNA invertase Pin-like site-specific DNA recombinase